MTSWTAARQASLSFTIISWNLFKLMSVESVMPSSVVSFSCCLQSFPASGSFAVSRLFASGGQIVSFRITPSSKYSALISQVQSLIWEGPTCYGATKTSAPQLLSLSSRAHELQLLKPVHREATTMRSLHCNEQ